MLSGARSCLLKSWSVFVCPMLCLCGITRAILGQRSRCFSDRGVPVLLCVNLCFLLAKSWQSLLLVGPVALTCRCTCSRERSAFGSVKSQNHEFTLGHSICNALSLTSHLQIRTCYCCTPLQDAMTLTLSTTLRRSHLTCNVCVGGWVGGWVLEL